MEIPCLNSYKEIPIPMSLYYGLDREDQELASDIAYKIKYQVLKDENNNIEQVLIPISDDLQFISIKIKMDNTLLLLLLYLIKRR